MKLTWRKIDKVYHGRNHFAVISVKMSEEAL